MVVHPAPGHYSGTLVNALMYHCGNELSGINGCMRPGIVHRIDMDTTGSLVICKNDKAHQSLSEQLKVHSIRRIYVAIVHGNIKEDSGTVNATGRTSSDRTQENEYINCKNGREAITHYKVLERFGDYTYIQCELETGRTHQIRVHMASIGHPLVGDEVYGPKKCPFKGLQGQNFTCTHSWYHTPIYRRIPGSQRTPSGIFYRTIRQTKEYLQVNYVKILYISPSLLYNMFILIYV